MSSLLILFNHTLTKDQEFDAKNTLKIHNIIYPSQEIKSLWANIPEGRESLNCYLEDVKEKIEIDVELTNCKSFIRLEIFLVCLKLQLRR